MRRIGVLCLVSLLVACVCAACVCAPVAGAVGEALVYANNPYDAFNTLAGSLADRTVTSGADKQVAEWLQTKLVNMEYDAEVVSFAVEYDASDSLYETDVKQGTAYNVVAYKRSAQADAPLLVIGAPYDNERTLKVGGGSLGYDEALYSASSTATLLAVAAQLYGHALGFDVAFVFWGASYLVYKGTQAFLDSNTQPLLGYIDLSFVAGGDDLNIYYDETTRTYGQYVDAWLARFSDFAAVQHKPFDPGYATAEVAGYPYGHAGLGANALFLQAGVPSIHLFGYNWAKHCETTRGNDVNLTQNDNLNYVTNLYGEQALAQRMQLTADLVARLVLTDQNFAAALADSRADTTAMGLVSDAARYAFTYTMVGLVVLAVVVAGILLLRRSKAAGTPDFAVNSTFINGQSPADGNTDDVFGTDDAPIAGDSNDVGGEASPPDKDDFDDIFGEH